MAEALAVAVGAAFAVALFLHPVEGFGEPAAAFFFPLVREHVMRRARLSVCARRVAIKISFLGEFFQIVLNGVPVSLQERLEVFRLNGFSQVFPLQPEQDLQDLIPPEEGIEC